MTGESEAPRSWVELLLFAVEQSRKVLALRPEDRDDATQEALISYHAACKRGDRIENPEAYIKAVLRRQAGKCARARRLRQMMFTDEKQDLELESVKATPLPVQEAALETLCAAMPDPEAAWFEDILSRKTDRELAEEHGITETAIRKRRERVDTWLQRFLEVRGHKRPPRGT